MQFYLIYSFLEPPQWTHEPNDQTAIKGKKVSIGCESRGYPKPNISWKVFDSKLFRIIFIRFLYFFYLFKETTFASDEIRAEYYFYLKLDFIILMILIS